MTHRRWLPFGITCAALVLMGALAYDSHEVTKSAPRSTGDPAADAFAELMPVLVSPRCSNCHGPMTFADEKASTVPPAGGVGGPGQQVPASKATHPGGDINGQDCGDCHTQDSAWRLGPEWPIQSTYQMCLTMKAARTSGQGLLSHLQYDSLIALAFLGKKGQDDKAAEPPPMSKAEFIAATQKWIDAMNAMSKYPPDPTGCARADVWVGSIQYNYSEVGNRTTTTAQGKGQFPLVKRGSWSGQAQRIEDHNATGCPSVLTGNASGNGNAMLTVIDLASGGLTAFSALADETVTRASLMISPMGYNVSLEIPMKGIAAYAGGGPACPGYQPNPRDFAYTIHAEANGQIDPANPDVLSGIETTTPRPGVSITTKWNFKRTRQ